MKKNNNLIEITLELPRTFKNEIKKAFDDELETALFKWDITLNDQEKDNILEKSLIQLETKVSTVSRSPWEIKDSILIVYVDSERKGTVKITLPSKKADEYNVKLVRAHDRWKVLLEPHKKEVLLSDFYDFYLNEILQWARTAVFYGVGSYA